MASIKLTAEARADLAKLDGSIRAAAVKKLRHLEAHPEAGKPLTGPLTGHRSLVFKDRGWRIVYELESHDDVHIWLIGKRGDNEVYLEALRRLTREGVLQRGRRRRRR